MPLNINGRVCVPATLGFGVAGILVVRFVMPFAAKVSNELNPYVAEILALLLMAYLAADLCLTVSSLYHLLSMVEHVITGFDEKMEGAYQTAAATPGKARETIASMLDFRQRYQLKTIKGFRFKKPRLIQGTLVNVERLSEFYRGLQDRIRSGK